MRLFFVTFVGVIACYFFSDVIWSQVAASSFPRWTAYVAIAFLIIFVVALVGYLEISKHDIQDKIRMHRNNGSMTPGLFFAALYFGFSDASNVGGGEMSDADSFSGDGVGGGGDGGD